MAFISPVMLTSFAPLNLISFATHATMITANVAKDFFTHIFLNPAENYVYIIGMGGLTVATCVGLAYLIKMAYDKYCLHKKN